MHRRVTQWADAMATAILKARGSVVEKHPALKAAIDALPPDDSRRLIGELHAAIRDTLCEQVTEPSEEFAQAVAEARDGRELARMVLLLGSTPPTGEQWKMISGLACVLLGEDRTR